MRAKLIILTIIFLTLFYQSVFAQRGFENKPVTKLPSKEKRWALIIGVSRYEDGNITPLPGANNDARALRNALRDYAGFDEKQIIMLTTDESKDRQPTKNNILRYLGNLSGTVPKDGLLLVSFSGHGIERQKQAFLLASDTPYNDNVKVLERTALSVSNDFKELLRDTGVGQIIILLDACRNDPLSGKSSSDNLLTQAYQDGFNFDVRNTEVEAFAMLYATSIGERAYEYTRENKGYFTWAFIEGLKGGAANEAGEVTLGALIRYVEKYVPQQVKIDLGSNKQQRPHSIIEGYKVDGLVLGVIKTSNSLTNIKNDEETLWETIKNSTDTEDFQRYKEKYPNGKYATVADLKIKELTRSVINEDKTTVDDNSRDEENPTAWTKFKEIARKLLKYDFVITSSDDLAVAALNNKYGFIDKTGKEIIPLKYDGVSPFSEGLAGAGLNGKYGFIDIDNKEIVPFKYDEIQPFSEGLAGVKLNGKYGFINKKGEEIIPFKYDSVGLFSEDMAPAKLNNISVFIDKSGNVIASLKYKSVWDFSEGLAVAILKGKYGFIDKSGKEVIPLVYDYVWWFSEGLAAAQFNGKYGFINKSGKVIIPFNYSHASWFLGGVAFVRLKNKSGVIDKDGKVLVPFKYDEIWCGAFRKEGFIGVKLNGKKGFVDFNGNEYFNF